MILYGTPIAEHVQEKIRLKIGALSHEKRPGLAVILVGNDLASHTYVKMKKKACESVGIEAHIHFFSETIEESQLTKKIEELNKNSSIHGILVQLPLPPSLDSRKILNTIDPSKDVDGIHPLNMGKLLLGYGDGFVPCTPLGIHILLQHYGIDVAGKHVVIVGRSTIVGRPLAALFLKEHATVTIAHRQTQDLSTFTRSADILVAAAGVASLITQDMVKEGAVVIDVGINRQQDPSHPKGFRLVGDVDFPEVQKKCSAITPVPKGVGPLTVAMLLHNTLLSFERTL